MRDECGGVWQRANRISGLAQIVGDRDDAGGRIEADGTADAPALGRIVREHAGEPAFAN